MRKWKNGRETENGTKSPKKSPHTYKKRKLSKKNNGVEGVREKEK